MVGLCGNHHNTNCKEHNPVLYPEQATPISTSSVTPQKDNEVSSDEFDEPNRPTQNLPFQSCTNEPSNIEPKEVLSIEYLASTYEKWKNVPDNIGTKASRTQFKWNATFNPNILKEFPWMETIKSNYMVIGVVCKICREEYERSPAHFQHKAFKTNQGAWINVPLNRPWGNLRESAMIHEFGKKHKTKAKDKEKAKTHLLTCKKEKESLQDFRKRIYNKPSDFPSLTDHLRYQINHHSID